MEQQGNQVDTTSTFIWVEDGNGMKHKYINLDNPNICPKEGVIEIESMKKKDSERNLSNDALFSGFTDLSTGIIWKIPVGIHNTGKHIQHQKIKLSNNVFYDRSIPDHAKKCAIITKAIEMNKIKDTQGKPRFKLRDKEKDARANIDLRSWKKKAIEIIEGIPYGEELKDIARNFGIDPTIFSPLVLADKLATAVEAKPKEFLEMYNSPTRPFLTILTNAQSMGIIEFNPMEGYKYGGLILGKTKELAVTELSKKPDMAQSIAALTLQKREQSTHSIQSYKAPVIEKSARELELERRLAEMEAKLKDVPNEKIQNSTPIDDEFGGDMAKLKKRAEELKIRGWQAPKTKYETLLVKVREAEKASVETV